jgi:hypothetical protein
MIWIPVTLLAIAGAVTALFVLGTRPAVHTVGIQELPRCLDTLLRRGYDGGHVLITAPGGSPFVQFRKYLTPDGGYGLCLGFPRAPWSEPFYDDVMKQAIALGADPEIIPTGEEPVTEFLEVDTGDRVELASSIASAILVDVFGLEETSRVRVTFHSVSPSDVDVRS